MTPIQIWVVDHNPADVFSFRCALRRIGLNCDLHAIPDGNEALALIREKVCQEKESGGLAPPDLLVLDSSLSDTDGTELLEAIRQTKVPVVMTSPLLSPRDRARKVEEFFQMVGALKKALPARSRK
jgi:CheY-like chemotaxis protein